MGEEMSNRADFVFTMIQKRKWPYSVILRNLMFSATLAWTQWEQGRENKAVQPHTKMNRRVMKRKAKFDWTSTLAGS